MKLSAKQILSLIMCAAYVYENGNVRITFDKDLRTGLHALDIFDPNLDPVIALT